MLGRKSVLSPVVSGARKGHNRSYSRVYFMGGPLLTSPPMSNRELFDHLFASGRMHLTRGPLFDTPPPSFPATVDPDKIEGMLLGLAVGDALGMTTEGPGWNVER